MSSEQQDNLELITKKIKVNPPQFWQDVSTDQVPSVPFLSQGKIVKSGTQLLQTQQVLPLDSQSGQVTSDLVEEQAEVALKNLGAILKQGGSDYNLVIKNLVYLSSMEDFSKFNEVYLKYFTGTSKPARSCVAMREFQNENPKIKLSIESVAVVPQYWQDVKTDQIVSVPFLSQGKIVPYGSNIVQTSGVGPINKENGQVPREDIREQAELTLKNLGAILKESGSDYNYVIKNMIYLTDMADFSIVNEVYVKYFNGNSKPARSCVAIKEFPHKNPAIKIGIDSVAIVPQKY